MDGDVRSFLAVLVLFALWLLMSGVYKPLTIGLGFASSVIAVYVVRRMDSVDQARMDLKISLGRFISYNFWLMWEIAKANWTVTKIVLSPEMPLRQTFVYVPFSQKTSVGKTIFANSITLTPGTITVDVEDGQFLVHAVAYSEGDIDALADMDRRVSAIETA